MQSEFGHAIWRVGATSFAVTDAGVVLRYGVGDQRVGLWDPRTGELSDLVGAGGAGGDLTEFAVGCTFGATPGASSVAVIGAGPGERGHALRIDAAARRVSRCAPAVDDGFGPWHARPERRAASGKNNRPIHFVYYPPTNPVDRAPDGELPPLIIDVHGGPTSTTGNSRALTFSLFCSRGFAVASVDYGGSTGYGRAYRDLLRHTWGTTDVEDCVAVARALAGEGLADPARTALRGGSAGGWTTLAALAHTDVFCCGVVYYPISDPLTWLGAETHDFESRYVESLVGRMPEDEERLRRVSPLGHAAEITAPFVMLQGLDDTICRPDQARRAVAAVEQAHGPGLCRTFLEFPGEGHGFRRAGSIAASLEAELCLFNAVMVLP
jgi:dipeptidyl aminopeptidase/acylaminoacyl peptidase